MNYFPYFRPLLYTLPPEAAHHLAIYALQYGLLPKAKIKSHPSLTSNVCGLEWKNILGLAAGFDKNAVAITSLLQQGFGFVEAGTATPEPQTGNPSPRLFRLTEDASIINRLGFNNKGCVAFQRQLKKPRPAGIVGANIGKNKTTLHAVDDYVYMLKAVYGLSDYITINISSPNTTGLRDLQAQKELDTLLSALSKTREICNSTRHKPIPLFLKIAPDCTEIEYGHIIESVIKYNIDGIILTNTTLHERENLKSVFAHEQGGLSGKALTDRALRALSFMYTVSEGRIPLIGVGGISSGEDAYARILHGASLIQVYTALIFQGFSLIERILSYVETQLAKDGFTHISQAVGAAYKKD